MAVTIGVLIAIAAIIWVMRQRSDSGSASTKGAPVLRTTGKCFREVVGESNYQPALKSITGGDKLDELGLPTQAVLVPENDNSYDSNAVAVFIDSKKVGYLSSNDARGYRAALKRAGLPLDIYQCPAAIAGGGRKKYGVWLDLPDRLT
jgi:hypothetical protein